MTDSTDGQIDQDPYADAEGRIGARFAAEVGDEIAELLADPTMWQEPPQDLGDRIVAAVHRDAAGSPPADVQVDDAAPSDDQEVAEVVPIGRFRRLRPALLGAAAAVILLIGGVVVLSAISGSPDETELASVELTSTGRIPDVSGEVTVSSTQSGLKIELDAVLPRRANGLYYEGWLRLDDDNLVPVGTFHEGDGVTLWAGIEFDRVVAFTITSEEAAPADDIGQASSGQLVLKADFPAN